MTATLSQRLWACTAHESQACLFHAFILGIGTGDLPIESFQNFLLQDAFYLHGFLQSFAHAITKASSPADTITLVSLMQGVNDELKLHASYMQSWGIDLTVVETTVPTAATRAYVDFLLSTAKTSPTVAEILAAMVPCARLYAFLGQNLQAAIRSFTSSDGHSNRYAKWIDTYASPDFEASAATIEQLLDTTAARDGISEARLLPLYTRAMHLEFNFFEAYFPLHRLSTIIHPMSISTPDNELIVTTAPAGPAFTGSTLAFALAQRQSTSVLMSPKRLTLDSTITPSQRSALEAMCQWSQPSSTSGTVDSAVASAVLRLNVPRVLCIAGSDSGGGAGIQADMKACTAQGVFSTSALTAITVQDTKGVHGIHNVPLDTLSAQINCVLDDIGTTVIKTGMLASADIIRCVVDAVAHRNLPLVVDPVMVSTSGHRLLQSEAHRSLVTDLFPIALLITPNLPEASVLLDGRVIASVTDMQQAAVDLMALGRSKFVLVKGGHLESDTVVDVLYDGESFDLFSSPRVHTTNTHGTGCTLAAAIAANYAKVADLKLAVRLAIRYVQSILHGSRDIKIGHGDNGPMLHWL
ncbi:phosphomethylpyrimidine kinase [Aphanomyces astaci]|uniref:Phosphomethylpyrimidine kinase n=1 Tax=Aphanomyces astaci TaxID=112090 RepID=W4FLV6_APHAT|nr:phosphomethylpyrimidine kinase [Aphanomyces astaci]ETV67799.1 phosphomethylpyrimidine kinase [Aphanomyces astaci]|eukprot:XP_009842794.1 phosphomethylpyrimidine kinase [Aphanomyces astaci]